MTRPLLYIVFLLSGIAGLIYETIWSRYLGLFVGHSAYAQVIVLVIFLGGMAIGAVVAGQRSDTLDSPLRWYAGIELIVGILGLFFHEYYTAVTALAYESAFPALEGSAVLGVVKWAIAGGLILPQSVLLGATFPLMTAALLRRTPERSGRVVALLYFLNSIGAAGGALLSGFYLVPLAGLPGTLVVAAGLNLIAALGAVAVGTRVPSASPLCPTEAESSRHGPDPSGRRRLWRLMLAVSFGTAAASFIYEVAWIRMLALVLGSATHAFELMLSAFIAGLALGALWIHRRADSLRDPALTLALVQWLMGFAALATLPLYIASFGWTAALVQAVGPTHEGYAAFTVARYGIALAVMLPSTFCAGMTLPLITRILIGAGSGERAVGWVYGLNTLGAITGVLLAALVLLPVIGLKALLIVGAAVDMLLGAVLLLYHPNASRRRLGPAAAVVTGVVVLVVALGAHLDRTVLVSGVYRTGLVPDAGEIEDRILFYRDGRTATVAVVEGGGLRNLSTNGKPDASLSTRWLSGAGEPAPMVHDEATQVLVSLITLAHRPGAATAAVIGQGSGVSSHMLLGSSTLDRLVTLEIEPEMIEGSKAFYPANARVFDDPRSTFVIDDARSTLSATGEKFDLIMSEPSNPWVSGVEGLFSVEFYDRVRRHLTPGGVFGQWLHLYEISDPLVLSVLAAIHAVFPSYEVFAVHGMDVLILASAEERLPRPDWSIFAEPEIRGSLRQTYPFTPPFLESTRLVDRAAIGPLVERFGQANSDFYPILSVGAEEARMRGSISTLVEMSGKRFSPAAAFQPRRPVPERPDLAPVPVIPAMAALSLSARVQAAREDRLPDELLTQEVSAALYRLESLDRQLESGHRPADWAAWIADVRRAEELILGGSVRTTAPEFFTGLEAYMERTDAPRPVRAAVAFLQAAGREDAAGAARAFEPLLAEARQGRFLLPPTLLRDRGILALLRVGDVAGARRAMDLLARGLGHPSDFSHQLVLGHLLAAEKRP